MTSEHKVTPTRYYTCVNCGHAGDYGFVRQTKLECQDCHYDSVTDHTVEEIMDHSGLRIKFKTILNIPDQE